MDDGEERIRRFCQAHPMAQRVLDMAAEQLIHTGMAMDEARKQTRYRVRVVSFDRQGEDSAIERGCSKGSFSELCSEQGESAGLKI